ncbi:MAG: DinB family protein [bacterium]
MTFTNPAGPAAKLAAPAYVKALMDVLGTREPFSVLAQQEAATRGALAGVSDDLARRPEKPGKWSLQQVLRHLADTEITYGFRMRMIVAEDRPPILAYDQDLWSERLHYLEGTAAEALDDLAAMRRMNLRFYRRLSAKELARWGMHSERGEESADKIVRMMAAHDLVHRRQLQRIRVAIGLPPSETP